MANNPKGPILSFSDLFSRELTQSADSKLASKSPSQEKVKRDSKSSIARSKHDDKRRKSPLRTRSVDNISSASSESVEIRSKSQTSVRDKKSGKKSKPKAAKKPAKPAKDAKKRGKGKSAKPSKKDVVFVDESEQTSSWESEIVTPVVSKKPSREKKTKKSKSDEKPAKGKSGKKSPKRKLSKEPETPSIASEDESFSSQSVVLPEPVKKKSKEKKPDKKGKGKDVKKSPSKKSKKEPETSEDSDISFSSQSVIVTPRKSPEKREKSPKKSKSDENAKGKGGKKSPKKKSSREPEITSEDVSEDVSEESVKPKKSAEKKTKKSKSSEKSPKRSKSDVNAAKQGKRVKKTPPSPSIDSSILSLSSKPSKSLSRVAVVKSPTPSEKKGKKVKSVEKQEKEKEVKKKHKKKPAEVDESESSESIISVKSSKSKPRRKSSSSSKSPKTDLVERRRRKTPPKARRSSVDRRRDSTGSRPGERRSSVERRRASTGSKPRSLMSLLIPEKKVKERVPPSPRPRRRNGQFRLQTKWGPCHPGIAIPIVAVLTIVLRVHPCIVFAIILLNPAGKPEQKPEPKTEPKAEPPKPENRYYLLNDTKHHEFVTKFIPAVLILQAIALIAVCSLLFAAILKESPKLILPYIVVQMLGIFVWLILSVVSIADDDESSNGLVLICGVGAVFDLWGMMTIITAYMDIKGYRSMWDEESPPPETAATTSGQKTHDLILPRARSLETIARPARYYTPYHTPMNYAPRQPKRDLSSEGEHYLDTFWRSMHIAPIKEPYKAPAPGFRRRESRTEPSRQPSTSTRHAPLQAPTTSRLSPSTATVSTGYPPKAVQTRYATSNVTEPPIKTRYAPPKDIYGPSTSTKQTPSTISQTEPAIRTRYAPPKPPKDRPTPSKRNY